MDVKFARNLYFSPLQFYGRKSPVLRWRLVLGRLFEFAIGFHILHYMHARDGMHDYIQARQCLRPFRRLVKFDAHQAGAWLPCGAYYLHAIGLEPGYQPGSDEAIRSRDHNAHQADLLHTRWFT